MEQGLVLVRAEVAVEKTVLDGGEDVLEDAGLRFLAGLDERGA